ncbi:MAG: 4'-phosphopantetheinyl transferase superfamily protein [Firmicutes bacterium]|nr:4'-phosphopantetheinyl transferase superfamily protein [Bacillota bacterium]
MELYLIEDYNEIYPEHRGAALTQRLVEDLLRENGWIDEGRKIRIDRLAGGKPVLAESEIHFSVSHTGTLFGCVIADEPVGLDIQAVTGAKARRLAERYYTEEEVQWMEAGSSPPPEDGSFADRFFRLWCRKEAYAKLTGEGFTAVLKGEPVIGRSDLDFTDLILGDGVYGCICTAKSKHK